MKILVPIVLLAVALMVSCQDDPEFQEAVPYNEMIVDQDFQEAVPYNDMINEPILIDQQPEREDKPEKTKKPKKPKRHNHKFRCFTVA